MSRPRSHYQTVREAEWQQQIIDTLHLHGWRVAHFRTAMNQRGAYMTPVQADGAGWPDLFAVHPKDGDVLAIELKAEYAQATAAQLQWLAWLEAASIEAVVWRPSDVDAALARIAAPQRRVRRPHAQDS